MSHETSALDSSDDPGSVPGLSRRAMLGGGAVALSALSGCASVVVGKRDSSESTYDLSKGVLRVDADYGDVRVRKGAGGVRVSVKKRGSLFSSIEAVEVTSRREGDAVIVESRSTSGNISNPPNVTVRIDVPEGVVVESLHGGNGDVSVQNVPVTGGTRVVTQNGDAELHGTTAALELVGADGVELVTGNGDAVARNVAGYVSASSTNGDVEVRECAGVGDCSTTNGDVEVSVPSIRENVELRTTNGDVEAALGSDLDAAVTARTTNGDIETEGVSLETVAGTYAEGTFGEGTHDLDIVTTNGDVELSALPG